MFGMECVPCRKQVVGINSVLPVRTMGGPETEKVPTRFYKEREQTLILADDLLPVRSFPPIKACCKSGALVVRPGPRCCICSIHKPTFMSLV